MRAAMMMSPDRGGIFDTLLTLARRGLGGAAAGGRPVHLVDPSTDDFTRAVRWLVDHDEIAGPANLASPNPLPNRDFMRALREAWGMPHRAARPRSSMLEAGAVLMRTETELVLKSRRVIPGRLLESGFEFVHPDWPEAAHELCAARRAA